MANPGDERLPRRFWDKVSVCPATGCWLWTARIWGGGYGAFYWHGHTRQSHRVSYEALVGPIADGLQADHLCRVRACCNPAHIEPVTCKENIRRGNARAVRMSEKVDRTHCKRGHEMTSDNVFLKRWRRPGRLSSEGVVAVCRKCKEEQSRLDYERAIADGRRIIKTKRRARHLSPVDGE